VRDHCKQAQEKGEVMFHGFKCHSFTWWGASKRVLSFS